MPLADASVDLMTLHCSFEHFEGDRDSRFVTEAERVLAPGGRVCILPLYMNRRYAIQTDPVTWSLARPRFERDALVHIAHGWGESHGRSYDAAHLLERIVERLGSLELTMHHIENAQEVSDEVYLRFAAVLTKPLAT